MVDMATAQAQSAGTVIVKAKRGDAVVICEHHRDWTNGEGVREYDTYEVGVVTSVTREGMLKKWRPAWVTSDESYSVMIPSGCERWWIIPAARFDIAAVVRAAREHTWPGHTTGLPKPYDSIAEVKAALGPCRREG